MKLAISPDASWQEVNALTDEKLVHEVAQILKLDQSLHAKLKLAIQFAYNGFLEGYYDVQNALPEHIESDILLKVYNDAYTLVSSLNSLLEHGNTNERLAEALQETDHLPEPEQEIWTKLVGHKGQHNFHLRYLISSLALAAMKAADKPDDHTERLEVKLAQETNPDRAREIQNLIDLERFINGLHSDRHEEYRERVAARKTPKDLPIRNSLTILKEFFEQSTEIPFSAGKYYPEIGYKSPAFHAAKLILKKIYPQVSDRKIAGIMQELAIENSYSFSPENEKKSRSTG